MSTEVTPKPRWSWQGVGRKTSGDLKGIKLFFDQREIATFGWFPPWQSRLMADNAAYMVRVLNAAFCLGPNAADEIEQLARAKT